MFILHDKNGNRHVITNKEAIEQGYWKVQNVTWSKQFAKQQKTNKTTVIDWLGVVILGIVFGAMFAWGF